MSAVGPVSRLTFSIDGETCSTGEGSTTVGIDHTFDSDLIGTLTAPDGTTVALFSQVGGSGNNFCQVVFDDNATRGIQTALTADAPMTGSWLPAEPLSTFVGHQADGTWTFNASDNAGVDTGSIRAASLHVSGFEGPVT